jgi:hypothetical protein
VTLLASVERVRKRWVRIPQNAKQALAAATLTTFGRVRAPMCTPEDLVVFKAIAGRSKDVEDAEALLALYPEIDRERVRARVAELSVLAEAPEMLEALDSPAGRRLACQSSQRPSQASIRPVQAPPATRVLRGRRV